MKIFTKKYILMPIISLVLATSFSVLFSNSYAKDTARSSYTNTKAQTSKSTTTSKSTNNEKRLTTKQVVNNICPGNPPEEMCKNKKTMIKWINKTDKENKKWNKEALKTKPKLSPNS